MVKKKSQNFIECLDSIFMLSGEAIEEKGEDSYCCRYDDERALLGVFDGCGGLGSRYYPRLSGYTGAYISSRLSSGALCDWFNKEESKEEMTAEMYGDRIRKMFDYAFDVARPFANSDSRIRGSMVKDLPTTVAICYARPSDEGIVLNVIWAGDSRVYILDYKGLAQVTMDDTEEQDALENLRRDGVLTNVVSAEGDYKLNCTSIVINKPTMVYVATDGCFGYIPSPMQFEYMLLDLLNKSENMNEYKDKLSAEIKDVAGDDYTLGFMSFYSGGFKKMKRNFLERRDKVKKAYISPITEDDCDENYEAVWREYKKGYERYLRL